MKIELTKNSKYRSKYTKYRDVVDVGYVIGTLDDGDVYKYKDRIAYNNMVWRIPKHLKYLYINVYYEIGSDIPIVELNNTGDIDDF